MKLAQSVTLTAALVLTLAGASGCRSSKKGVRVGSEAATLKLQMANLDERDQNKPAWLYELSGCTSTLNGELGENNTVSFSAVGLKQGLQGCQFRVKVVSAPAGIIFAQDAEQNVLYWSRELELTSDAAGQLSAVAGLQKLYQVVPSENAALSFTLKVPVTFPAPEAATPVTAEMKCNPLIANIGTYEATSTTSGVLTFPVAIDQETPYTCTQLFVSVKGIAPKYRGALAGDAANFKGVPSQTTQTTAVVLTLGKPDTGTDTGTGTATATDVDVKTTEGKCKDTEHYDTQKHACVAN